MAENDTSQEKTEQPSAKRLHDAKKKGQVPRSRELNVSVTSIVGAILLMIFLQIIYQDLHRVFDSTLGAGVSARLNNNELVEVFNQAALQMLFSLSPYFLLMILAVLFTPALMGGWAFSLSNVNINLKRINPMSGLGRMFGPVGLMELFKSLLKVVLIGTVSTLLLMTQIDGILGLGYLDHSQAIAGSVRYVVGSCIVISMGLILIAAVDIPFQLWTHHKKLRMTKQELKEEYKETDGNPETKSRVRGLQRELAQRRMMEEVPRADVVIVNPTHFSVALRYRAEQDAAPIVVAKGVDEVALKIRQIALAHNVSVFSAPMLARSIYFTTKLNHEIPDGLYVTVAKVLAYVFQLRNATHGRRPEPPTDLSVPDDLRFD